MKKLQNFGVQELNAQELIQIDGGIPAPSPWWGWASVALAVIEVARGIHEGMQESHAERCH